MATITKKQTNYLMRVLSNLERARAYVHAPEVAVAKRGPATTTLHYVRSDGPALYEVERTYGSELCLLDTAIQELRMFVGYKS